MGGALRLPIAALFGAVVTFALFYMMQALIHMNSGDIKKEKGTKIADFLMPETEIRALEQQEAERPPEQDEPPPDTPPPSLDVNLANSPVGNINFNAGKPQLGTVGFIDNSDMVILVRIPPQFPARAQSRGIEGFTIVEFTVLEDGTVANPVVLEGFTTAGKPTTLFNRSSQKAVLKFKYQPKMVDGKAVKVDGVQYKFTFQLKK